MKVKISAPSSPTLQNREKNVICCFVFLTKCLQRSILSIRREYKVRAPNVDVSGSWRWVSITWPTYANICTVAEIPTNHLLIQKWSTLNINGALILHPVREGWWYYFLNLACLFRHLLLRWQIILPPISIHSGKKPSEITTAPQGAITVWCLKFLCICAALRVCMELIKAYCAWPFTNLVLLVFCVSALYL